MTQSPASTSSATVADLLRAAAGRLPGEDARREAECLLEHVLDVGRAWLFAYPDHRPNAVEREHFEALVERRQSGEPLAYIVGHTGFWTLDVAVSPATLIPRVETELLVELALEHLPTDRELRVAELGTGSGAIALALASERPRAHVIATDISDQALQIAQANAQRNHLNNVEFRQGDWLTPLLGERFHLIASNPPYMADDDPHLQRGDLRFEPGVALSCGVDGLAAIRLIVAQTPPLLESGGWLVLEHGLTQGEAVRDLLRQAGFRNVQTHRDLEGRERISLGCSGT